MSMALGNPALCSAAFAGLTSASPLVPATSGSSTPRRHRFSKVNVPCLSGESRIRQRAQSTLQCKQRKALGVVAAIANDLGQTTVGDRGIYREGRGDPNVVYDAIIIGSGVGGLTTATQMAKKGANVLVLEKYIIPGGSAGWYDNQGFRFDVGSSMMFGLGDGGNTNLLTRVLAEVGKKVDKVPDPTQLVYHLPNNRHIPVWRDYDSFLAEMMVQFPHEAKGIRDFYDEAWNIFNALNSFELKSLEEPRYLLSVFAQKPLECLKLAVTLPLNVGDVARKYIKDPELLYFIDVECYIWSTVNASFTPMINAGMVLCDRHYGGIHYPVGGVGEIPLKLAEALVEMGSTIEYKARVSSIIMEDGKAVGVKLVDGRRLRSKLVISNATRWDTFENLLDKSNMPEEERAFQTRYKKSPSFLTIHLGIKADVLPPGTDCHHVMIEDWSKMEEPFGTIFVSIPSVLDSSLAPPGYHTFHTFTPAWIDDFEGLPPKEYEARKKEAADKLLARLEAKLFPGLRAGAVFMEVGTPRTHRKFLGRESGTYGPIPSRRPLGVIGMPFNRTAIPHLYCVGDSTFPGQGVNAVAFSGVSCAHRALVDLGLEKAFPWIDTPYTTFLSKLRDTV